MDSECANRWRASHRWGFTFVAIAALFSSAAEADSPPNFVLIYADDLGYADLGCYGNQYFETPHIDELLSRGLRFTSAYSGAPLCAPSRVALLSGRYSARVGCYEVTPGRFLQGSNTAEVGFEMPINQLRLPGDRKILSEHLKEAGYYTGFFGKWHVGSQGPAERGFDEFVRVTNVNSGGSHLDVGTAFQGKSDGYPEAQGDSGDYLTTCASLFLDRVSKAKQPFFLYLAHTLVHIPIEAKQELISRYESKSPSPYHDHPVYAAMVDNLDANVGRLLDHLRAADLLDNTWIVFTSDNGGATGLLSARPGSNGFKVGARTSNVPLRGGKCQLFEGGIRVPMGMTFGDGVSSGVVDEPVTQMDLLPTFLQLAGISPVSGFDGRSLVPVLNDWRATEPARSIYWHFPGYRNLMIQNRLSDGVESGSTQRPASAVRRGDWKLIESLETGDAQLYNLSNDVGERNDVASDHPTLVSNLKADLRAWRTRVRAPMIEPKPPSALSPPDSNRSGRRSRFIQRAITELDLDAEQASWFAADQAATQKRMREFQKLPTSEMKERVRESRKDRSKRLAEHFTPAQLTRYFEIAREALANSGGTGSTPTE
ncbi:MAG: sulfatase [Planctomycetota bacterium]